MNGITLTSEGLEQFVAAFGATFFPPLVETIQSLAPWIVAVAGAIGAYKLVKKFTQKLMGIGGSNYHPMSRRQINRAVREDFELWDDARRISSNNHDYKMLNDREYWERNTRGVRKYSIERRLQRENRAFQDNIDNIDAW